MKKLNNTAEGLRGVVGGLLWCAALLLAFSAIVAWLVHGQVIDIDAARYGVVGTMLVSSLVSTLISVRGNRKRWKIAIAHFAGMILVLILGNLVFGIGSINGLVQSAVIMAGGSGCAILVQSKPKKQKSYIRRKI